MLKILGFFGKIVIRGKFRVFLENLGIRQRRLDSCHVKISTNEIALFSHRVCEDFWPSNLHWTQKYSKNIYKY